ncbi:MAG TPA: hypothetical protein PKE06_09205 [Flavilitoribacter sp.]|nr:hypothetical protein [Flavilitoribacter sp.]HMQ87495.1 hypothetical protein [Flavilitoribacter sp.]
MKFTLKHLILSATVIMLTCSFSPAPSVAGFGGAFLNFSGKMGGEITKKEMSGKQELGVEGCAKGSRIFKFSLAVTHAGKTETYESTSNKLSAQMTSALDRLTKGDAFEFKDIKAYLPNGKSVVDVHANKFTVV